MGSITLTVSFIRLLRRITYRRVDAVVALTKTTPRFTRSFSAGKDNCIPNNIDRIPDEKSNATHKSIVAAEGLMREKGTMILFRWRPIFLDGEKGWSLSITAMIRT
jgi:hypothetical protein